MSIESRRTARLSKIRNSKDSSDETPGMRKIQLEICKPIKEQFQDEDIILTAGDISVFIFERQAPGIWKLTYAHRQKGPDGKTRRVIQAEQLVQENEEITLGRNYPPVNQALLDNTLSNKHFTIVIRQKHVEVTRHGRNESWLVFRKHQNHTHVVETITDVRKPITELKKIDKIELLKRTLTKSLVEPAKFNQETEAIPIPLTIQDLKALGLQSAGEIDINCVVRMGKFKTQDYKTIQIYLIIDGSIYFCVMK